jgi:hypothetical protein
MSGIEGVYLGDGVYVADDGWLFELQVSRDDRIERVFLDPGVMAELVRYARQRGVKFGGDDS